MVRWPCWTPTVALQRACPSAEFSAVIPKELSLQARIERLDALLPQTQCGQCGYPGCRPYAEAMARGEAGPDRCPPGGDAGALALANALGVAFERYDRSLGNHYEPAPLVRIVEPDCIGCTKCIQACPVDAIIGGPKAMHVVIEDWCTGCELCIPACPVDCIELLIGQSE